MINHTCLRMHLPGALGCSRLGRHGAGGPLPAYVLDVRYTDQARLALDLTPTSTVTRTVDIGPGLKALLLAAGWTPPTAPRVTTGYECRNCRRPLHWLAAVGWLHGELPQYADKPLTCHSAIPGCTYSACVHTEGPDPSCECRCHGSTR